MLKKKKGVVAAQQSRLLFTTANESENCHFGTSGGYGATFEGTGKVYGEMQTCTGHYRCWHLLQ